MPTAHRSGASDTDVAIRRLIVEAHRRMSPAEKMRRVLACNEASAAMARAGILRRHGPLPEVEVRLRLASLVLDRQTMIAAFGWDPEAGDRAR